MLDLGNMVVKLEGRTIYIESRKWIQNGIVYGDGRIAYDKPEALSKHHIRAINRYVRKQLA